MIKNIYLTKHPIKMELDLENKMIEYYLPESKTLEFPVTVTYEIYDVNGNKVLQKEDIQDAKAYNEKIKNLIEKKALINSVGDIEIDNIYDYQKRVEYEFNRILALYEKVDCETMQYIHNEKSEIYISYEKLKDKLSLFEELIPTGLNCCYKDEETGEIIRTLESETEITKTERAKDYES